ncbi:(deoxy)nucleoside triphosphate pyrophosphohydrolase [Ferrimonas marina]|uniref:8-oxo-dGTP diphosphatase n=1 Tax=Ferrimonas marina TaxID=299255 RepID=A0A1M5ZFX3_9GAMM|nr:(deoxy)nucleoside triphosphate pyrophosphohydrolase [Ferrimonas marina]SHI23158.1 (d)CTP diphosphatase [Ferrimonas marina]
MILDVVAALLVADDKVLVARRHPESSQGGLWEFPGGKVEPGESHQAALVREIQEELSVTLSVGPFLATSEHRYPGKTVRLHGYLCHWQPQPIVLTGSHDALAWHTPEQVELASLAPADWPLLAALQRYIDARLDH